MAEEIEGRATLVAIAVGRPFGPYEIRDVLGKGASATVFIGRRSDGVDVAVKVLSTFAMGNADFRAAVPREFNALNKVANDHVIRVEKMGTIADVLFIEMEWIDGPTLDQIMTTSKPLPFQQAVTIAVGIADALEACHNAGVVHRDVKPSNVLMRGDEDPVLFDFGLAQDAESPASEPGRLYATPMTASPEQVAAEGMVDGRADVYALGVTLFRMVAGKLPFYGERMDLLRMHAEHEAPKPSSINKAVPESLEAVILRAIEKQPADRFQTAGEFRDALRALPEDDLITTKRKGLFRR